MYRRNPRSAFTYSVHPARRARGCFKISDIAGVCVTSQAQSAIDTLRSPSSDDPGNRCYPITSLHILLGKSVCCTQSRPLSLIGHELEIISVRFLFQNWENPIGKEQSAKTGRPPARRRHGTFDKQSIRQTLIHLITGNIDQTLIFNASY